MLETRREFIGGAAAGLAALYMTACGSGSGSGAAKAAATDIDLLYSWTYVGPPGSVASFWRQVQTRAKSSSPDGQIKRLQEVPVESLFQTVDANVKAKSGPTVYTYFSDLITYLRNREGSIKPIDDLVSKEERGHWLLASAQADGKYWGAPQTLEVVVLVINRKHFEKAKIDVDRQFESYDHFIEACDRLKAAGITPIEVGTSDGLSAEKWLMFEQLQVCDSPATGPRGVLGEIGVDDPFFARPSQQIPILRDNYMSADPYRYTETMAVNKFMKQQSAGMTLMYTHPVFAPDAPAQFEVIGFPKSDAKFNRPALGTGNPLLVTEWGRNPEAAGKVMEFLHQPEQVDLWWQLTRSLPADDRLDKSQLTGAPKATWDLVLERKGDLYSLWWPNTFYPVAPALTYTYSLQQDLFAGKKTTSEVQKETDKLFSTWRKQNPKEAQVVKDYIKTIDEIVQRSA